MVANFRTYEGQLRLLTAVIAAHPELKLNYKELAKHFGSDWSESGVEHFFRPIKKNAKEIQGLVRRGEDAANYDHKLIHKYFGDSTPDGIQFQFRAIKKDAENLKQARGSSGSTAPATPSSSGPKTPRTGGSRKRAAPSTGKSTSTKKQKGSSVKFSGILNPSVADDDDDDNDSSDNEFPPIEMTPTKSGIRINHEKMAAHERAMGITYPKDTPALDPTQTITSDDEDEVRILTPADARTSFPSKKPDAQAMAVDGKDASQTSDHDSSGLFSAYTTEPTAQEFANYDDEC
ncbi:hypothetical protein M406DRAFT_326336 [Cryphonectria parasitica EP155]|uniref:Uncharacterized protein n=1 Tax=Cryphonectria parasitica (strain ATCC 38755 / EP155) TaxID=660469 RepID=A0A9P4YDD7_CRYP1|nr:uncharacterized protein M406DRAFT_326336 [Cryphonectria parasitica EP155]KAF3770924.1 hypothetical protein M406DRAFT_326336 [Cryphonectria parasitica EP155]